LLIFYEKIEMVQNLNALSPKRSI